MSDYYAGIGGSSGNAGTSWAARKALPSQAYALASGGDTVYIGPGSYNDNIGTARDGSSGNLITMIGDYSGANTDGVGGVVRVYSASANYIGSYNTWRGIYFSSPNSGAAYLIQCEGKTNVIIEDCAFSNVVAGGVELRLGSARTIRNCYFYNVRGHGINFDTFSSGTADGGDVVENCIFMGIGANTSAAVRSDDIGGLIIRNCLIAGGYYGFRTENLPGGYTANVINNSILMGTRYPIYANSSGYITEDYNALGSSNVARTNVSTGANSVTIEGPFDVRWWFELVSGGSMLSPFDLASFSSITELNSGTGAPTADARGTTVQGTYREWGPLEYDSTLDIEAGAGGASVYRRVARILGG